MTSIALEQLPPRLANLVRQHAAALISDPTKDQRYRATQLGSAVASYLSWKENEQGAAATTLDTYERVLARLAVAVDKPLPHVTLADLRAVRDDFTRGQRRKATAIIRDFFRWAYEEERIRDNPAGRMRAPKREQPVITDVFDDAEKAAIVTAQTDIMDRAGVLLLLRAGLRQAELRNLQVRDVNLRDLYLIVRRGKGGKGRTVPIKGELVRALNEMLSPMADVDRGPEDYILCPTRGGRSTQRVPSKPMGKRGAHEWWYRCLARAGVVPEGATSGRRMHGARHTYATDLLRATDGNAVAVSKNMGHSSIDVTVDLYGHFDLNDQRQAVAALPEIGDEE